MNRSYYSDSIAEFLIRAENEILGALAQNNDFSMEIDQRNAWLAEIRQLRDVLKPYQGKIYFEYSIPRLGKRIDVVVLICAVVFVIEYKVGERVFAAHAIDQVWDYALDLKNFHEPSHHCFIAPILIATEAESVAANVAQTKRDDCLLVPICCGRSNLGTIIECVLAYAEGPAIDIEAWQAGRYCPTPTIIEAAMALYGGHAVTDISRSDASAVNLTETSDSVSRVIYDAKSKSQKAICFVTGVPGAGKTLVGLNIATKHSNRDADDYSVFLSGNGPLVAVLQEALACDKVRRAKANGKAVKKGTALSEVKAIIQNVHHFRDECLIDLKPPIEHVALFDEAQRAWNRDQTAKFMLRKKNRPGFSQSEPEFLISCLDRHPDWAVVICLVGGGQEINTGEAGIGEWIESLMNRFSDWRIYISSRLNDSEFGAGSVLKRLETRPHVEIRNELHLGVSMRSFRAENVSLLVKQLLDLDREQAKETLVQIGSSYPIVITRQLSKAKGWLRENASGSERFGIVVSSQAQRLKPHAIDVRSPMDPKHWFLKGKDDVRSSYYLEDVATEFHVQGLELDWACVMWDGDFRYRPKQWEHWSFQGTRWNRIRKEEDQRYLKNAYRVLLTRARQGMVVVVPEGDSLDPTRSRDYYDSTYAYLQEIGFIEV